MYAAARKDPAGGKAISGSSNAIVARLAWISLSGTGGARRGAAGSAPRRRWGTGRPRLPLRRGAAGGARGGGGAARGGRGGGGGGGGGWGVGGGGVDGGAELAGGGGRLEYLRCLVEGERHGLHEIMVPPADLPAECSHEPQGRPGQYDQ